MRSISNLLHMSSTALSLNSQSKSLIAAIIAPLLGFVADLWGIGIALSLVAGLIIMVSPLIILKPKSN